LGFKLQQVEVDKKNTNQFQFIEIEIRVLIRQICVELCSIFIDLKWDIYLFQSLKFGC